MLPTGGVATPALFHSTSRRDSCARKVSALRLIVVRSDRSRCRNVREPDVVGMDFVIASIAAAALEADRDTTYTRAPEVWRILQSS